jgi:hypothetical protein
MRRKRVPLLPGIGCTGRRIAMGMTAEVADTPCKRRRSGFDSRHLHGAAPDGTAHFGIEEDGNLPDPESGETRFDSAGPDHGSLAETD